MVEVVEQTRVSVLLTRPLVLGWLACLLIGAAPAAARTAVVAPADDHGAPLDYLGDLPHHAGGLVPLTWSHVAELVPLVVAGATVDDSCPRYTPPDIDGTVDEALRRMTALDPEGAVDLLDLLVFDLPCLDEPASSVQLADIFYYRSAALAFMGDDDGSRRAMRRAVAVEPSLEPDENLPGKINTMLAEEKAFQRDVIAVRLRTPKGFEVRIDGQKKSRELAVDGLGLLQWQTGDGAWQSALLRDIDDEIVLGTPIGIQVRLQYRDDPFVLPLATALGEALREPMMVEQAVFWDGGERAVWWDDLGGSARWLDEDPPPIRSGGGERDPGRAKSGRDDHLRVVFGGGISHYDSFPYATAGTDISILLYRRLSTALGANATFPLSDFVPNQVMPLFYLGLRLRLGPLEIPVHPWLGLSFCGSVKEENEGVPYGLLGGALSVGVDLSPVKHLVIRLGVQGGFLEQSGYVHATMGVGFGV